MLQSHENRSEGREAAWHAGGAPPLSVPSSHSALSRRYQALIRGPDRRDGEGALVHVHSHAGGEVQTLCLNDQVYRERLASIAHDVVRTGTRAEGERRRPYARWVASR